MIDRPMTLAESFYVAGRCYVTAAHAIVRSPIRKKYETDQRYFLPTMMLIGHAIEVYLKAWLAQRGYSEQRLTRKPFAHDIRVLYEEAVQCGLPVPEAPPQHTISDLVESYEQHHRDYALRYPTDGRQFWVPSNFALFPICKVLDNILADDLGFTIPVDLDWSVDPEDDFRMAPGN